MEQAAFGGIGDIHKRGLPFLLGDDSEQAPANASAVSVDTSTSFFGDFVALPLPQSSLLAYSSDADVLSNASAVSFDASFDNTSSDEEEDHPLHEFTTMTSQPPSLIMHASDADVLGLADGAGEPRIVAVHTTAEVSQIAAAEHKPRMFAVLSLRAPPSRAEDAARRPSISLSAVLDRSGSMAGKKIKLVKATTDFIATHLRNEDKLGVVAYDTMVRIASALTPYNT